MEFFKKRTGAYYFALIVAIFSIVTAFLYRSVFGETNFMSDLAFYLIIGAGVAYVVVSTLGACNLAAAIMTGLNFAGFCVYVRYVYEYLTEAVIGGIDWSDKGFIGFVTVTACMLICCLLSNIAAWMKMKKSDKDSASAFKKSSKKMYTNAEAIDINIEGEDGIYIAYAEGIYIGRNVDVKEDD